MAAPPTAQQREWTVADLLSTFGPITHRRIRQEPAPGTATEQDVLDLRDREKRLYELVDGVLVEKPMGVWESYLAARIIRLLGNFLEDRDLGFLLGPDGMARLSPGLVRIPDVSLILWNRLPDKRVPDAPMLGFAPDLAVEVISPSNTPQEMERKRGEYFGSGVRLVWYVRPEARTVEVFTAPSQSRLLREDETLTAEPLLSGFSLPLRVLFAELA